ncbi:LysR family transcriptional regulator [Vibrio furnissii]|uniref:LysR family transcriptional regulator n=1 Tax=Vibrio furnissii TaxID=29494 RepID=UPI0023DA7EBF|nr:LysR family transcriptional regulator [Vibrio furnissii]
MTKLTKNDLSNLNAFCTVERLRSFTHAANELGITSSALSHAIKNLEERLGVKLLNRTSRTVAPTDAGTNLARRLAVGFKEIGLALDDVNRYRDRPFGKLRLSVLTDSARLILGKYVHHYLAKYPDVQLEISVNDQMVDIVAEGFDAGIRFGGTVPEDFVAAKLGDELKWVTVASPKYLFKRPELKVPEDLLHHTCIRLRSGRGEVFKWDFSRGDDHRVIEVQSNICVNETALSIELSLAGVGITYCLEDIVKKHLLSGELVTVLPDWCTIDPPMYLYYPGHRQVPQGLIELISTLREELSLHRDMNNNVY